MATPTSTPSRTPEPGGEAGSPKPPARWADRPREGLRARYAGRVGPSELALWGVVVLAGLVLRLIDLGDRAFHHDESQVAYFSFLYWRDHTYEYNPLLHGPWQYMLTALTYAIAGVTDFTARLAPALVGSAMVALPFFCRKQIGRIAALTAAVLLAVSPTVLYFSRFAREDIHIAALTLAVVVVVFRFLDRPRAWHPVAVFVLLAATLTVKESALFFGALSLLFIALTVVKQGPLGPVARAARALPWWSWVAAVVAFAYFYLFLFTSLFTAWDHWDAIREGIDYWSGQQDVGRGGEPWFFYFSVLGGHEWPIVVLAAVGAVAVALRPTAMTVFLIVWFAGSLAFYTWASEKFAWLALHPLLPLILLAGIGVEAIWRARRRALKVAGGLVIAVGAVYLGYSTFMVNADGPVNPRELLVSTQSAEDTERTRDEVVALDRRLQDTAKRRASVLIDPNDGASFPWAWYFRDLPASYDAGVRNAEYVPTSDVLILTDATRQLLLPKLADYRERKIDFRVWWIHNFHQWSVRKWWRWLIFRTPFSPTGGMWEWLYVRRTS